MTSIHDHTNTPSAFDFHNQDDSLSSQPRGDLKSVVHSQGINASYEFTPRDKDSPEMYLNARNQQEEEDFANENYHPLNKYQNSSPSPSPRATPTYLPPPEQKEELIRSFDWESTYLNDDGFVAASVKSFKHVSREYISARGLEPCILVRTEEG